MTELFETPNPTLLEEFGGLLREERGVLLRALATSDEELAARDRNELDDLDQALERLEYGTFGVCEGCDEQIPLRRLRAVPTTRYCVGCQKQREAHGS